MAQHAHKTEQSGFVGSVSDMSLADIVQIKGVNRYSGCLVVEHHSKNGVIFFREGDVVHAEQEGLIGEEAFYSIMGWGVGTFRSEPKVSTTSRTIEQSLGFLVLEALRRLDESNVAPVPALPSGSGKVEKGAGMSDVESRLKVLPDVEQALIMTKEGAIAGDNSYQAEFLGANGLFLAQFAAQLGSQSGFGELKSVTVHGGEHHLFLFDSKRHYLCVSANGSGNVNALDSDIRRVLAKKAGG